MAEQHHPDGVECDCAHCPHCDAPVMAWDSTTGLLADEPAIMDQPSVCFQCGELSMWANAKETRACTPEEREHWDNDPTVIRARRMLSYTKDSPRLATAFALTEA